MSGTKLSTFYSDTSRNYHSRSDVLKFALIPFMFLVLLGAPGKYGGYVVTYSNFVAQAFFILFGFFTLVPDKTERMAKLKKSFRRAFKLFALMFVCFLAINIIFLAINNSLPYLTGESFMRKRTFFDFFVLNIWPLPFGNSIWFVQSLTYAYLFFIVAEKLKLSKLYLPILIILIAFTLATGELSAFCGFPIYGYAYIPGNFATRAIPYMLIGMYLHKHIDRLAKVPQYVHLVFFAVGLGAAVGEVELLRHLGKLTYLGHTVGFCIMALSLCCLALGKPKTVSNYFSRRGNSYSRRMYALCQPVSFALWLVLTLAKTPYIIPERANDAIFSFIICFIIVRILDFLKLDRYITGGLHIKRNWKKFKARMRYERKHLKHQIQRKFKKRK